MNIPFVLAWLSTFRTRKGGGHTPPTGFWRVCSTSTRVFHHRRSPHHRGALFCLALQLVRREQLKKCQYAVLSVATGGHCLPLARRYHRMTLVNASMAGGDVSGRRGGATPPRGAYQPCPRASSKRRVRPSDRHFSGLCFLGVQIRRREGLAQMAGSEKDAG
jgi:hypothetical protein